MLDAHRITDVLQSEGIEVFISSPYLRAQLTIEELAKHCGKNILVVEDLKERRFLNEDSRLPDNELFPLIEKSFSDLNFALPGRESNRACEDRAIRVLKEVLKTYQGKKVVVATHGCVLTLMMGNYDSQYDLNFLRHIRKNRIFTEWNSMIKHW